MAIRIRFDILWTLDQIGANNNIVPLVSQVLDQLLRGAPSAGAEMRSLVGKTALGQDEVQILWDVELTEDDSPFSTPDGFKKFLEDLLLEGHRDKRPSLDVQAWRRADFSEAVDHAEILSFYEGDTTTDDFPVFRPEPHPDWEEANEVFRQDGVWFWAESEGKAPTVGPTPKAIFTPWENDYLDRVVASKSKRRGI